MAEDYEYDFDAKINMMLGVESSEADSDAE